MNGISSLGTVKKIEKRDMVVSFSLLLYILFQYIPVNIFSSAAGSGVLYLFLGITFYKLITKQTPIKVTPYSLWYLVIFILSIFSFFYALDGDHVLSDAYFLLVSIIVTFAFIQYLQNNLSFMRIFAFFSYSPLVLVIYLLISGQINTAGERLGDSAFGNANILAETMMISLFCTLWSIIYSKKKYLVVHVFFAIIYIYVIALTGGRKYILVPIIYFLLLIVFKYWKNHKTKLALYTVLFLLVVIAGVWCVMNIPVLYNVIGTRFEGLFSFFSGNLEQADASTIFRYMMIENGWQWFLKQPILGYGLNNFGYLFSFILSDMYAHNNFIEILVDLGMIGFLLYYSFYVYLIIKLFKIRNDSSGLRNFFLVFMLVLLPYELGAITYKVYLIQIFIGLASAYVWLYTKNQKRIVI